MHTNSPVILIRNTNPDSNDLGRDHRAVSTHKLKSKTEAAGSVSSFHSRHGYPGYEPEERVACCKPSASHGYMFGRTVHALCRGLGRYNCDYGLLVGILSSFHKHISLG